jgi:hypothetical protein
MQEEGAAPCSGGAHALSAGATHVPNETRDECRRYVRARTLKAREHVPNTKKAYGDTVFYTFGNPLEWNSWCLAGPGTVVYGVETSRTKVVYNALVTPEKVQQFMTEHLIKRELRTPQGRVISFLSAWVIYCSSSFLRGCALLS